MKWHHEPSKWSNSDGVITILTEAGTDFWRKTHYGFIRDNGHFFFERIEGDFTAQVKITGSYEMLYDQAGLMIRIDESNWIKCGIEFVEGVQQASVVVTREFSDWSVISLPNNPVSIWFRVIRRSSDIEVQYSLDKIIFQMLCLAYLGESTEVSIGLMCASPDGNGFSVVFEDFQICRI